MYSTSLDERVGVHRAVIELDPAGVGVEPGERVLHPVLVVAVGEVLAGMRAADFLRVTAPSMVTSACWMRFSYSSVSTRSVFQIIERSADRDRPSVP